MQRKLLQGAWNDLHNLHNRVLHFPKDWGWDYENRFTSLWCGHVLTRVWVWFIARLVRLIAAQLSLRIVMVFMILEVLFIWWLITWRRSFSLWALFTLSSFLLTSRTFLFFLFESSRFLPSFPQEFFDRYATKSQKLLNPLLRCNKISYLTFNLCFNRFRLYFPRKFSTLSTLDWLSRLHPTPCRRICYRPPQFHIFCRHFLSWMSSSIWPKWFLPPTALTF